MVAGWLPWCLRVWSHQTDGPGAQVQEAPEQVQRPQTMHLTQQHLKHTRGQRSARPGGREAGGGEGGEGGVEQVASHTTPPDKLEIGRAHV